MKRPSNWYASRPWLACSAALIGGLLASLGYPNATGVVFFLTPLLGLTLLLLSWELASSSASIAKQLLWRLGLMVIFSAASSTFSLGWVKDFVANHWQRGPLLAWLVQAGMCLAVYPQVWVFAMLSISIEAWANHGGRWQLDLTPTRIASLLTSLEILGTGPVPTHLGQGWISLAPYLRLAQVFSYHIYSFLGYLLIACVLRFSTRNHISWYGLFLAVGIALGNFWQPISYEKNPSSKQIITRMFQGHTNAYVFGEAMDYQSSPMDVYVALQKNLSSPVDLGIIPESELYFSGRPHGEHVAVLNANQKYLNEFSMPLIVGGIISVEETHKKYNGALLAERGSIVDIYLKHLLAPGVESGAVSSGNASSQPLKTVAGTGFSTFTVNDISLAPLICYEALSPSFVRRYFSSLTHKPQVLVTISDSSWVGPLGLEHAYELTKWRAVEFNIPLVRVDNAGYSGLILPTGEVDVVLTPLKRLVADVTVPADAREITLFQQWGYVPILILMIIAMLGERAWQRVLRREQQLLPLAHSMGD